MATFNLAISSARRSRRKRTVISEFENGAEQRQKKGSRPNDTIELTSPPATSWAGVSAYQTFYDDRDGEVESFNWTDPFTSESLLVRFDGEMRIDSPEPLHYRASFTFRVLEVL